MPTDKSVKDTPEPTPQEESQAPAVDTTTPAAAPEPTGIEPGVYEYTHYADCVYPSVPLTARAGTGDTPATVFDWPFGPPQDGRWSKTRKKPNQAADNAPAPSSEE
jgi:hypothetical protein